MRLTFRLSWVASTFAFLVWVLSASLAALVGQQHEAGAHHHPQAAQIKNPVPADARSIAAGQKLFAKNCASCHGDQGKGDGMEGEELDPKPADLTDDQWKHGSSDGEIYVVIRDGVRKTGMKAFGSKMTGNEIWDVVNYVLSIGPKH
jgi:cbb3-type cytochrome c oxidase subunit III